MKYIVMLIITIIWWLIIAGVIILCLYFDVQSNALLGTIALVVHSIIFFLVYHYKLEILTFFAKIFSRKN
jgi:hypothetical protein